MQEFNVSHRVEFENRTAYETKHHFKNTKILNGKIILIYCEDSDIYLGNNGIMKVKNKTADRTIHKRIVVESKH